MGPARYIASMILERPIASAPGDATPQKPRLSRHGLLACFLFGVGTTALVGACNDDEPKRPAVTTGGKAQPGGGSSSGSGDGGTTPGEDSDSGLACTDLENTGPLVDQVRVNDDLPIAKGGTIEDGTYDLSQANLYVGLTGVAGPSGNTYRGSLRITGTKFERVIIFQSSAGTSESRVSGDLIVNGENGTIALTCPFGTQEQVSFTMTDSSLTLANLVTNELFVFNKTL